MERRKYQITQCIYYGRGGGGGGGGKCGGAGCGGK